MWTASWSAEGRRTGAEWLTCCEEWQLVPVPANRPHLCLTCQCPHSVSANQPLNWTQLAPHHNPPFALHSSKAHFSPSSTNPPHHHHHSTSHSASVSSSCGTSGRHFSVFMNVPRPINAVACRPEPVICCLPPSWLSAAAPHHPSRHLHRDQNALIQFMQSLLFLNSHFVCSDEGPYCPLGRPSHVRDGGKGGTLYEQESSDLEGGVTDIFICYLFPSFFLFGFMLSVWLGF